MLIDEVGIALDLGRHLDALGVVWLVGGSLASSLLGEPRATDDVDLVADLRLPHVQALCARLVDAYYVDENTVRWAVQTRRTFNVIHFESTIKVDIYCSTNDALSRVQLERRLLLPIAERGSPCTPSRTSFSGSSSGSSKERGSRTASGATCWGS